MADGWFHDIDSSITHYQRLLSITPRSDPRRPGSVLSLAITRLGRHNLSNKREDLDKAIVHLTEWILSLPLHGPNFLEALCSLARNLFTRSKVFKQPEDAAYATKYLFHLRDWPQKIPTTLRREVMTLLVDTLALQVEFQVGNVMQNIREMAVLTRELLALNRSDVDIVHLIYLIPTLVLQNIRSDDPDQPLDEFIEFLRAVTEHRPDLLEGRTTLAMLLVTRYSRTCLNDDYEEARSTLDEIITYTSPGNSQDTFVAKARGFAIGIAAMLAMRRSITYQTPEILEEAIYRARIGFSSSSFKEHYPSIDINMEAAAKKRFHYFGSIEGVEASSGQSAFSLLEPEILELDKMKPLFSEIHNSDEMTKIDEAVGKGRSILASSPDVHLLDLFCDTLVEAFVRTEKIQYLNESINLRRQSMETPLPQNMLLERRCYFASVLLLRFLSFPGYRTQDLNEGLELLSEYVTGSNVYASLPNRLRFACMWAFLARRTQHSSVSTAYEIALSLMQDTLLFSPTLQLQHTALAIDDRIHTLPLDYASYRVDGHHLEEAIETLERGRALLWSEMRHLRTSIDQLLEADPDLGHKFAAVNRELEELTKSVPPSHKLSMDDGAADGLRAVDPFGRLVLKQRGLLKERAKLISQIQALPGFKFDSFLASPSFDTLRSAASSGPVIIINHSEWRSDILILLPNMPPSLISTPRDFYKRASALKDKLLDSRRKSGLDSPHYEDNLAFVLADLYKLVGKPVIDRLRQLQVPEQSRVWWCPTSVFCSLPLHAMGPIPSDDGEPRYFLDLYICSYTPTLSALIQSRNRDPNLRSSERPSVLLVAQPDPSLPTVAGEIQAVQSLDPDTRVTSLISEAATPTAVIDGFHNHGFVHFACHGTLETGKPFEAGFELHDGARLTLLEIVRAHIPTAEFAFLSACHTAEMTEGSIVDEGLHLAAAVQYCGFRSVVGTMWAMADEDGRDLAKNFYKALFSNTKRDQGLPYHEISAEALQFAVKRLQRKRRISLERWVNFVHYGA